MSADGKWDDWIGRERIVHDVIDGTRAAALAATLGDLAGPFPVEPAAGTPLPPLWHWAYFWELAPRGRLGPDGHAARGDFLPPIDLPQRMWAGSRLSFHADMPVGTRARRISAVNSIAEKQGRSGPLAFVTVGHRIEVDGATVLEEEHDIVYRDPSGGGGATRDRHEKAQGHAGDWRDEIAPDPVLLFRYSALTFNGHRIHYDRDYATGHEGYPGLVVHGPLLATLMMELVRRWNPDGRVTDFEFRARAPIFDTEPFFVCGTPGDGGADVWIEGPSGGRAMEGRVGGLLG